MNAPIRPRDRDAVLQSLRAGVVPRSGQHLIQVGRVREIETMVIGLVSAFCAEKGGSGHHFSNRKDGACLVSAHEFMKIIGLHII